MKKIIGNLLYDTEKAEKIYSFRQKRIVSNFGGMNFMNGMTWMYTEQKKIIISFMVM